jgi:hypothetical protein
VTEIQLADVSARTRLNVATCQTGNNNLIFIFHNTVKDLMQPFMPHHSPRIANTAPSLAKKAQGTGCVAFKELALVCMAFATAAYVLHALLRHFNQKKHQDRRRDFDVTILRA